MKSSNNIVQTIFFLFMIDKAYFVLCKQPFCTSGRHFYFEFVGFTLNPSSSFFAFEIWTVVAEPQTLAVVLEVSMERLKNVSQDMSQQARDVTINI